MSIKSINGLAWASIKARGGLAIASIKAINGLAVPSSYTYYSTVFDGSNDYLTRGADLTGISDGKSGVVSFWIKMGTGSSDTGSYFVFANTSAAIRIQRQTEGKMLVQMQNNAAATKLSITSNANSVVKASGWVHVLASWDLSAAGRRYIYISDSDQTNEVTFLDSTLDYTKSNHSFGADVSGNGKLNALVCECYLALSNAWFDITTEANRRYFITAAGKPANLPAAIAAVSVPAPAVYFNQQYNSFETNQGGGGDYTVTGALADGGADIP